MLDATKGLGEGSGKYANPLTDLKVAIEANRSGAFSPNDQRLDYATRHGQRLLNAHDQRGDAGGAIDGAPTVAGEIENDEDITRK